MVESHLIGAQHDTPFEHAYPSEAPDRYLTTRFGNDLYPMPAFEKELFDTLLSDKRWTVKTIGLQLVAETFAVALFRMLAETSKDPLLRQVCKLILQDESRHMGFGMLCLPDVVGQMTDAERKEMEEVTHWALVKTLTGQFPAQVYQEVGFSEREIKEIHS